jgi:hypothetical protein
VSLAETDTLTPLVSAAPVAGSYESNALASTGDKGSPIGWLAAAVVAGWTSVIVSASWGDNSALTHLETGRRLLRGTFPRSDPYTFSATGTRWTLQSWLPSLVMAAAERIGGSVGVAAWRSVVIVAVVAVGWWLSSVTTSLIERLAALVPFMVVGQQVWSERPLMVGLIAMGAVLAVAYDMIPPWVLVPVGWIWVNSHGSFVLAPIVLGTLLVGDALDAGSIRQIKWSTLGWCCGGLASGVLGPLGPRALTFPLVALRRSSDFANIVEWQAPRFVSSSDRVFLVMLLGAVLTLVKSPSWRHGLLIALMAGLALTSQRNMSVASLCLIVPIASAFDSFGTLAVRRLPAQMVGVIVMALLVFGTLTSHFRAPAYPTAAVSHLATVNRLDRVAAPDFVGNFITNAYGGSVLVMFDDRVDMLPASVVAQQRTLYRAGPDWEQVLRSAKVDTVVWQSDSPLAAVLAASERWNIVWASSQWIIAQRR